MTANYVVQDKTTSDKTRELIFAGDDVRLSGQIDYPHMAVPADGYPLLFVLHHAGCEGREWYQPFAQVGLQSGYAVFRWDKRGTGHSGASGCGSTTQDAVNAYDIALEQPHINRKRVVILAQGAGTGLLGSSYGLFARLQVPYGVVLASNMLDETEVLAIDCAIQILVGEFDWNPSQNFAEGAAKAHKHAYSHGATYHIIPNSDRKLLTSKSESSTLHPEALSHIESWLKQLCPISRSI